MKYDPIMCMMVDDTVRTKDEEYKMKVTSYVINKGQSGEYYGLKNKETNQVLYSAPNNWKSREGAKRWAEKKGMIYVEDAVSTKSVSNERVAVGEIKRMTGKSPTSFKQIGDKIVYFDGLKKIAEYDMNNAEVRTFDSNTLDKAIKSCDDLKSDKEKALEEYKKAKEEYQNVASKAKNLEEMKALANTPEFKKFAEKKRVCMQLGCRI